MGQGSRASGRALSLYRKYKQQLVWGQKRGKGACTNCSTSQTFLWVRRCHTDDCCCRSLQTVWSGQICFRRFPAPADCSCLFLEASGLSTLTTAQQVSLCYDCNWGDGTPPAKGEGKGSLRLIQAKDKPHLQLVWCDGRLGEGNRKAEYGWEHGGPSQHRS